MALTIFEIDSYRVYLMQAGPVASLGSRRLLLLESPADPTVQNSVYAYFEEIPSASASVAFPNPNGFTATVFARAQVFAEWYDVLRNENPVYCGVSYADAGESPTDPSRAVFEIQVYTGSREPPGEGPEALLARLRDSRPAVRTP